MRIAASFPLNPPAEPAPKSRRAGEAAAFTEVFGSLGSEGAGPKGAIEQARREQQDPLGLATRRAMTEPATGPRPSPPGTAANPTPDADIPVAGRTTSPGDADGSRSGESRPADAYELRQPSPSLGSRTSRPPIVQNTDSPEATPGDRVSPKLAPPTAQPAGVPTAGPARGVSALSPITSANSAAGGGSGGTNPLVALGARATRLSNEGATPAPRAAPLLRPEAAEVAPQVGRALASLLSREGGSVQIRLNPEWLGAVRVEMTVREGSVSARLEAEHETARELLAGSLDRLRATLEQRGLRVEKLEIADGSTGRESPEDPDGPGGRRTPAQDDPGSGGREAADGRTPWNGDRGWARGGEPDRRVERRRPEDGARPAESGGAGTDGPIDAGVARSASWWSVRLDTVA